MISVDFGTGQALVVWGPNGRIEKRSLHLPKVKGGKTPRDEFRLLLKALLEIDDVVVESPTVGSSGCEVADVEEIISNAPNKLYTLSARVVKNYRKDYNIPTPKSYVKYETLSESTQIEAHILDAEILYNVAVEHPERLRVWHQAEPCERLHKSVRPHDKRGYRDKESDDYMANLPPFDSLPDELKAVLGISVKKNAPMVYSRAMAMPFAVAMEEPYVHNGPPEKARKRFEKVIGLYDHGYPSFYRRSTINWMQKVAKDACGVSRFEDVSKEERKKAWKVTQRQIRMLFHLAMG